MHTIAYLAQVSAIKQSIAELRAGLKKAETEIATAQRLRGDGEGAELMEAFASSMAAFRDAAAASVETTEVCPIAAEELLWLSNKRNVCWFNGCFASEVQASVPQLPNVARKSAWPEATKGQDESKMIRYDLQALLWHALHLARVSRANPSADVSLQAHEADVYAGMKSLTAYFGEDWDAGDPSRVLRVVRDFVNLFDKAHREIEVLPSPALRTP